MVDEFRVSAAASRLGRAGSFQQSPSDEARLNREVMERLGFSEGDIIQVEGWRNTVARVSPVDGDDFNGSTIILTDLLRNNARVLPGEIVTVRGVDPKPARRIALAPLGKRLKRSELLKIVASNAFSDKPFMEGDLTYLRSSVMRHLLGPVTWMRVVRTEPSGAVLAREDTEFELASNPQPTPPLLLDPHPEPGLGEDLCVKHRDLGEEEWEKIGDLLELGVFTQPREAVIFLIREGIRSRSDMFEKCLSLKRQIRCLKADVERYLSKS